MEQVVLPVEVVVAEQVALTLVGPVEQAQLENVGCGQPNEICSN